WLLGVGAVAFGGGYLQLVLNPRGGPAPFLYQPVGLGLALILLFGPRVAPGLALGALAAPLAAGAPAAEAAGNALAVMAEALSGYSLLRRRGWALQPRLERPRDVFLLAFAVIAPA